MDVQEHTILFASPPPFPVPTGKTFDIMSIHLLLMMASDGTQLFPYFRHQQHSPYAHKGISYGSHIPGIVLKLMFRGSPNIYCNMLQLNIMPILFQTMVSWSCHAGSTTST